MTIIFFCVPNWGGGSLILNRHRSKARNCRSKVGDGVLTFELVSLVGRGVQLMPRNPYPILGGHVARKRYHVLGFFPRDGGTQLFLVGVCHMGFQM